jgi:hypothetical protein
MHQLSYALATLAFVFCGTRAQADDSGHNSIDSLKWQMRQAHRSEGHRGPIEKLIRCRYPDGAVNWSWDCDRR